MVIKRRNSMNQDLSIPDSLDRITSLGEVFFKSNFFKDIKTANQAIVKIIAGKELGLSPFQSMSGIYLVNEKLALQSNVMSSLIKRSDKYDYFVDKLDVEECTLTFSNKEKELGKSTFTIKDAAKAGLVNKENWKNYPKNMLFARALSNGARWYCPDVICGWHTAEELQDIEPVEEIKKIVEITSDGEVSNGTNS